MSSGALEEELRRRDAERNKQQLRRLRVKQEHMRSILRGDFGEELRDAFLDDVAQCFGEGSRRFTEVRQGAVAWYRLDFAVNEARGCYSEQEGDDE
jgi:hypothetical protein